MKSLSIRLIPLLALSTLNPHLATSSLAQSTIDSAKQHSWAANTGFINWKPNQPLPSGGAVVNEFFLAGKIYSANLGWIDLGSGTPANGIQYSNTSAVDFGVNVNPATGALTGYAFGANIGWISFEQRQGRPAINMVAGEFTGHAWSANTGWITLGGAQLATQLLICTDADGDGMSDQWEHQMFGNTTIGGPGTDKDGDGATDAQEYLALTDPNNAAEFLTFTELAHANGDSDQTQSLTWTSVPGRLYTVQLSTNLQTWANASGLLNIPGDAGATTSRIVTLAANRHRYFFRVLVKKPLQP